MIILDLETMGVESTTVVLSFGATHITEETDDYQKMLDSSIFVKFDIASQYQAGRTDTPSTLAWWDRQVEPVKVASLWPDPKKDLHPTEALVIIRQWISQRLGSDESVFARGSMDSVALDSIARTFDVTPAVPYNRFYDVRTAIDMTYETAKYGYVDVDHPTFDVSMVLKHHPVHDCAYDGMMLLYGKK